MPFQINWELTAVWTQTIANTIVLFMIYRQISQVNTQMVQSDEQEKYRRSWEFVRLYRDELREEENKLATFKDDFRALIDEKTSEAFTAHMKYYFRPRLQMFALLNQLVQHQDVDERILFGYLEDDFNQFVELGVRCYGLEDFKTEFGPKIKLLLTLWGSHIKSTRLLYGVVDPQAKLEVPPQAQAETQPEANPI